MYLPKIFIGVLITGITASSIVFPPNSFAHHFFSQYVFPTATPTPFAAIQNKNQKPTEIIRVTPTATPTPFVMKTFPSPAKSITPTQVISKPTQIPTPIQNKPTNTPTSIQSSTISIPTTDVQSFIMNAINDYRHSQGLGSVQMNTATCNFATTRAQEIASSFSHDGFTSRVNGKTLPYAGYSFVTENLAETTNYKEVVSMWSASPGHAANMRADTPYVCVVQNGNFFAYEGWKP